MISFFILGCLVTIGSLIFFLIGWLDQGQFLFGPFIATLIGVNFMLISFTQVKREREENKRRRTT
ncbi:hypothetical protein [Halalkalibacter alkalisediminis]|uniref:Uncharacterized protein n=1 Tax=Halalkalibacter alkalisediminis TaxID=935616 RepID=A0ABV6NA32_9BACI|nr:hypothetical protein [Halalkalibacter alkalisediminis]